MALSAPDLVARFKSIDVAVSAIEWLDDEGRKVARRDEGTMARLFKRTGASFMTILVDRDDVEAFARVETA